MEDNETPSPDYQKGFNEGYLMAQHLPDLARKLAKAIGESERGLGFQDGRKQLTLEQSREKYPSWLGGNRTNTNVTDPGKTRDKEEDRDIEPEI